MAESITKFLAPLKAVKPGRRAQERKRKIDELTAELEKLRASATGLEKALQAAKKKEREMAKSLGIAEAEKKKSEDALTNSNKKLQDAENQLQDLRNEFEVTQGKFKKVEDELKAAVMKQTELMENLKSAESLVEEQAKRIEEGKMRITELESENQISKNESEQKYQELMDKFTNRDAEARSLLEKLKRLEDEKQKHEQQAVESARKSAVMLEELQESSKRLSALGGSNGELLVKVLVEINTQLKDKANDLQKQLESSKAREEATVKKLASHTMTIEELQKKLSQYETDNRSLDEANKKLTNELAESESKLNDLREKLSAADSEKDGLTQQLNTERQRLESEISSIIEEKNRLHEACEEAKKGHESVTAQLQDCMKAYGSKEAALNAEIKNRSSLEAKLKALEQQLYSTEARLKKAESAQADAASSSQNLRSQKGKNKLKVKHSRILNKKVKRLQQELRLAKKKGHGLLQSFINRVRNLCKGLRNLSNKSRRRLLWKKK